mmetsp:Transcript_18063/g.30915  ORF Transcript_18063/g.30915 Transcript_18063/m.30915 type:complete len:249 (-) Transcript_18063:727-1473(-)|eukprot:CAMPEP_0119109304 /NCGR_PEP_ID=MMETSP1180-20130426/17835_1 /TAXON_ID=3052 ORGANISM="Chlamydomonas cf sp, Strain CCMP681" /NCGR_SAMPLE_ID=MMETSP1180 /ASSEMBLY_ACC=CAM_ASM_000741 /LENGTH=248 /DNA_ID=CAMNT_0007095045 /DNA_START=14 /DNA_END=760 /DNA_ORIENTATION=+
MRLQPLGVRMSSGSLAVKHIFVKEHEGSAEGAASALFVSGLPLRIDEAQLVRLFSAFGHVQQAVLHGSKRSGMVTFSQPKELAAVLKASQSGQILELPSEDESAGQQQDQQTATGLKALVLEHKAARPGLQELQHQLDEWTEAFEEAEAARVRAQQTTMTEDGWTVVVRTKGRKRTKEEGGVVSQSGGVALAAAQALAATKQVKPLEGFYLFQQRDKRRNELMDLREKFDEDRRRVSRMRMDRNFRPV